ncbi:MAG: NUDIX domain-containing protein [Nitrososphaerota archaeon]|nr:NUDIX domain-containing protein [Nitrososphaerota archaeon]
MFAMDISAEPVLMVGVIIAREDGKLLIHKSENWRGKYTFPGGKVMYGETLEEAVIRTAQEETGITVADPKLLLVMEMIDDPESSARSSHIVGFGFTCTVGLMPGKRLETAVSFEWADAHEAEKMDMVTWARKALEKYTSGNTRLQFGSRVARDLKDAIDMEPD